MAARCCGLKITGALILTLMETGYKGPQVILCLPQTPQNTRSCVVCGGYLSPHASYRECSVHKKDAVLHGSGNPGAVAQLSAVGQLTASLCLSPHESKNREVGLHHGDFSFQLMTV